MKARQLLVPGLSALGFGASGLLLVDYVAESPRICGHGGCGLARDSAFSQLGGVPLPVFGLVFFGVTLLLALMSRRRTLLPIALAGAAGGLALIAIQLFVLKAVCPYCMVTDLAAVAIAAVAWLDRARAPERITPGARVGLAGILLVAGSVPFAAGLAARGSKAAKVPVPEVVKREQRPGVATIVEFVDFECPYCRKQHVALTRLLAPYGARVRVVRKLVPLPSHEHALDAARAACCAEELGRGEAMADALFRAEDLSPEACARLAAQLGIDRAAWQSCLQSERTAKRIEGDTRDAVDAGVDAFPTFWIGGERFIGLQKDEVLAASIERALGEAGPMTPADATTHGTCVDEAPCEPDPT